LDRQFTYTAKYGSWEFLIQSYLNGDFLNYHIEEMLYNEEHLTHSVPEIRKKAKKIIEEYKNI